MTISYVGITNREAIDFIRKNEEVFAAALLADTEFHDIKEIDDNAHTEFMDRAYTLADAAFVITEASHVENDSGFYEGQDPEEALKTMAAYTVKNNVMGIVQEKYDAALEEVRDLKSSSEDESEEDLVAAINVILRRAMESSDYMLGPIEPGSSEEKYAIRRWLSLNDQAGMWSNYPVGQSYIDSRCGVGYGIPDVYAFVDYDNQIIRALPHLHGMDRDSLRSYYEKNFCSADFTNAEDILAEMQRLIDRKASSIEFFELSVSIRNLASNGQALGK